MRPILLVEDDADDIELTTRAFERARILNPIVIGRNGADALDYLGLATAVQAHHAKIEDPVVVLLDLRLPGGMDGLDVLVSIRNDERTRQVPVAILTCSSEDQDRAMAATLQVNAYIRKPVEFDSFVAAAQRIGLCWTVINQPPAVQAPVK